MKCSRCMELISDYLDDGLDEATRKGIEEHLDSCTGCAEELRTLRACVAALASMDEKKAPEDFLHRLHDRIESDQRRSWLQVFKERLLFHAHVKVPLGAAALTLATLLLVVTYQHVAFHKPPIQPPAPAPELFMQSPEPAPRTGTQPDQQTPRADRPLKVSEPLPSASPAAVAPERSPRPVAVELVLVLSLERHQGRLSFKDEKGVLEGRNVGEAAKFAPAPKAPDKQQGAVPVSPSVERPGSASAKPALRGKERNDALRRESESGAGTGVTPADERAASSLGKDHDAPISPDGVESAPAGDAAERATAIHTNGPMKNAGALREIKYAIERLGGRVDVVRRREAADGLEVLTVRIPGRSFDALLDTLQEMGRVRGPQQRLAERSNGEDVLIHLRIKYE